MPTERYPPERLRLRPVTQNAVVAALFHELQREQKERRPFYKTRTKGLALHLLGTLAEGMDASPEAGAFASQKDALVRRAIDIIQARFSQPLCIDDLAGELHISKYHLCRCFKEITGKTVIDYVNSCRCAYARQLLHSSALSVTQAAYQSGYRNLSYFIRTYKKQIGMRPGEERSLRAAD